MYNKRSYKTNHERRKIKKVRIYIYEETKEMYPIKLLQFNSIGLFIENGCTYLPFNNYIPSKVHLNIMDIIEGKHAGTKVYVYDNYTYTMDKRFPHIYRCSKRKTWNCSGRIIKEGERYILKCLHNHPDDPCVVQASNMKREMIRLCQETTKPLKDIFDTVCRTNVEAATYISYNNVKSTLSHYRALSRPIIPRDLHNLREQLENYEPTRRLYKGYAVSTDNKIALIFTNESLLDLLSEACEIFVDGTFSVPKKPNIAQLYTVHVRYADTGIVTVFALCEGRSCSFYKAMWEKLISLAPGLQTNLKFIMADYEKAAISAMSEQFPMATINGCWFHYSQALRRKWRRLGLSDAPCQILYMAQTIALAPCHLFQQALNIVQRCSVIFLTEYPAINEFIAYIEKTWLPFASKVSVYGCPNRTNNLVESFYASITKQLCSSSNIWKFLECIDNIICDQTINYERLKLGHPTKRLPTKRSLYKNKRIEQAQKDLVNKRISLQQFLQLFGQPTEILVINDVNNVNSFDNNEIRNEEIFRDEDVNDVNSFDNNEIRNEEIFRDEEKTEKITITNNATITKKAIIVLERIDNIEKKRTSVRIKRKVNCLCCNISHSTGLHRKLNKTSLKKRLQPKSQHHPSQATCRI